MIAAARGPRGDAPARHRHAAGEERRRASIGARCMVGGGMGRTPMIADPARVRARRRSAHLSGGLPARLQSLRSPRQHLQGADQDPGPRTRRGRISPTGRGRVCRTADAEGSIPPRAELDRIAAYFAPPAFESLPARDPQHDSTTVADPEFARWLDQNVTPHKQAGYAIVNISLKPIGGIPGDATSAQIDRWPTSPNATARRDCASPTRRTSSCRM